MSSALASNTNGGPTLASGSSTQPPPVSTLPTGGAFTGPTIPAFEDAYNRFCNSLPQEERKLYAPCATSKDVIDAILKLQEHVRQRQKQRLIQSVSKVALVAKSFEQFFKVVDVMIQSNPTHAALIWGALRFVLQLAANFSGFYDRIISSLERLAQEMAQYNEISRLYRQNMSSRMRECLEKAYAQLFDFFQTTCRIFISGGKVKRALTVVGDLMWKPFDDRFADVLERLRSYRDLIRLELSLSIAQSFNDAKEIALAEQDLAREERRQDKKAREIIDETANIAAETKSLLCQQRKEQSVDRIKHWLSAPEFAEVPYRAQNVREDGTATWIFDRPQFLYWKDSEWGVKAGMNQGSLGENALWVYGNPGCGKTVLASHILQEFQQHARSQGAHAAGICYFFFANGSPKTSAIAAAYRSILTQIVHLHRYDEDLLDTFNFIMGGFGSSGSLQASSSDLESLFKLCLKRFPVYLLLDGVDECEDITDLIRDLLWLSNHSSTKALLFGRTNIARMNRVFPQPLRLDMDRSTITKDVVVFLNSRVETFIEEELLPEHSNVSDIVDCLARGADGMFLWARLMINYLSSPAFTPFQRMKTILSVIVPEGLDKMYHRISDLIAKPGRTQLDLARQIITWAAFAAESITVEELHDVLTFRDAGVQGHQFRDFQETISVVCGGLVECYRPWNSPPDSREMIVRCIHLSVKEHFSPSTLPVLHNQMSKLCLPTEPLAHLQLLESCLEYMSHYRPLVQTSGLVPSANEAREFARYAAHRWSSHLSSAFSGKFLEMIRKLPKFCEKAGPVLESMTEFLENPTAIKSWIEMYYSWAQGTSQKGPDLNHFANNYHWMEFTETTDPLCLWKPLLRSLIEILRDLMPDVNRLTTEWGARLAETPAIIWDEIPAFIKSKFIGHSTSAVITPLTPTTLERHNCSSKSLCTISRTASNSQTTSVLTVWPSKIYEQCWESRSPQLLAFNYPPAYQDWTARYEVWQHEHEKKKIVDTVIPLCPDEISILLRQTYRLKDHGAWGLSFPLAISTDLFSVVILRTIYSCHINANGALDPIESALVPMDFDSNLDIKWSANFKQLPQDWYSYNFNFSSDNQYLLFWDCHHQERCGRSVFSQAFSQDPEQANVLAIFRISRGKPLAVKFINKANMQEKGMIRNVAFHPYRPFVALDFGVRIEAWRFMNCDLSQFEVLAKQDGIKDMMLSACGKFLIFKAPQFSNASVIPLPEDLQSEVSSQLEGRHSPTDGDDRIEQHPEGQLQGPLTPGQIIHSPGGLTLAGGQKGVVTISAGNAVTINLSAGANEATHSFEIVSLPDWKGIEHTTPTVIMPKEGRTSVNVILNKSSEDEYSLSKPADERLPLLITREVSAIRFLTPADSGKMAIRSILDANPRGDVDGLNGENKAQGAQENDEKSVSIGKRSLTDESESDYRIEKRRKLPNHFCSDAIPSNSFTDNIREPNDIRACTRITDLLNK